MLTRARTIARLLQDRADPNGRDTTGQTPLHKAAVVRHVGFFRALLEAAADPDARDAWGLGAADWLADRPSSAASACAAALAAARERIVRGYGGINLWLFTQNDELMNFLTNCNYAV